VREGNNLKGFKNFCKKNDSSQGQNLVLSVLCVPNSLDSGFKVSSFGLVIQISGFRIRDDSSTSSNTCDPGSRL